jgi:sulfite dehydrogenase (cytochrome) subunit A
MTPNRLNRRSFLRLAAAASGSAILLPRELASAADPYRYSPPTARFPEKTDLIMLTDRPPNLETPIKYFRYDYTPNEAFFVRWHESGIPTSIDTRTFRLNLSGHVNQPLSLSLADLRKQFEPVNLTAACQCSGNSRSFFDPPVTGGEWGNGAVGNARWTGVRLSDLLDRAGLKDGAIDVSFAGVDVPPVTGLFPFVKSLDIQHAADREVMVAYAMNDADLPMLNGFPLRLIVPGWFATYWVKSLSTINILPEKFKGFWMDKAYRIPNNPDASESPDKLAKDTIPINRLAIRSLFVTPEPSRRFPVGKPIAIDGVAFDSGQGITKVELSTDAGATWTTTALGQDLGKYAWRRWRYTWQPPAAGDYRLRARATNAAGETQPATAKWNRAGYQRNVIEHVDVTVG